MAHDLMLEDMVFHDLLFEGNAKQRTNWVSMNINALERMS